MEREVCIGLLGILIGGIIGHFLSIGRDKRNYFIKNTEPLKLWAIKTKNASANDIIKYFISQEDVNLSLSVLKNSDKEKLHRIQNDYKKAYSASQKITESGGIEIIEENIGNVRFVINKILDLLEIKWYKSF
jgi:hypothetical protein